MRQFNILTLHLSMTACISLKFLSSHYSQRKPVQPSMVFSVAEALVKIIGLRLHYFTVPWNLFDFILVGLSIFSLVIEAEHFNAEFPIPPTLLRVVRVFRIGRILRLIKVS